MFGASDLFYTNVAFGSQCWFAENLRSEEHANCDAIPGELTDVDWSSNLAGAQANYGKEAAKLITYGRSYNCYAVDDMRGFGPSGWHVPTDAEHITLKMELGMSESEANSSGWRGTHQGARKSTWLQASRE
jgi:uncharacterized protein (TIGR02145 family)